jgi:hypothetical protein
VTVETEPLEGLAELEETLNQLPNRIAKAAVQRVLRRGAELFRIAWSANARVRQRERGHGPKGRFKASIAVSSRVERAVRHFQASQDAPAAVAYAGPTKAGYPEAMMEEFGAPAHNETPPSAPGRRAWEAEKQAALNLIAAGLGPEIEKTVARFAKRQGG